MTDGYDLTLKGLLRKRGEVAGEVEALRSQMAVKLAALDHIDATIRVFKPDIDLEDMPERPAPAPNAAFRGEVQRFLLDTIRRSDRPLTTHELGEAVMRSRGLDVSDRVLAKLIRVRTGHSLSRIRKQGFVVSERYGKGADLRWMVTPLGESGEPLGGWRNGSG